MKRRPRNAGRGDTAGQLQIEWNAPTTKVPVAAALDGVSIAAPMQMLPWDFKTSFPQPMPEAIDAGVVSDEDTTPEGVKAIHEEHARELLVSLRDQDALLDARRREVDPATGRPATTPVGRERLQKLFATEPARLERWWNTLIETYESAFGTEAADAFGKAIRAWHAGVKVCGPQARSVSSSPAQELLPAALKSPWSRRHRIIARLPVPRPLAAAVAAGHFGQEENGKPVRPTAQEIREITEQHAEKLIGQLDAYVSAPQAAKPELLQSFQVGIRAYAEDFGDGPAAQLEVYVRRQAGLDTCERRSR